MMKKYKTFGELFAAVAELPKQADKAELLLANNSAPLQYFLHLALQPATLWNIPQGHPPFTPDKAVVGYSPSHLFREMRLMYLFLNVPVNTGQVSQARREQMFIQILERIHPTEADLLIAVKDKTFSTEYKCPRQVIVKAFPHLPLMEFTGRLHTSA